jgi:class 3 adenylate cyclase/tetratricopeptide (TPR) repeat protein
MALNCQREAQITELERPAGSAPSGIQASQILTFLIADLRGYTRYSQEHGDEAAAALATRFADLVEDVVSRHDGTVIEVRGDEVLSVFSSARQALRAAKAVQDQCLSEMDRDPSLALRAGIGVDAGEAVPVGTGFRGRALNLAARLCSLAGAGEVLASSTVTDLAGNADDLAYTERGLTSLKGFAEPVAVMQVLAGAPEGAIAVRQTEHRVGALPIGGFLGALAPGPLVGRGTEQGQLWSAIDTAAQGRGRLVLLTGEAGVGKTRLAQELTRNLRNHGFVVLTGRCYEPYTAIPFYPFHEAMATAYAVSPPALQSQILQRWPHLGRLLPEQGGQSQPASLSNHEEQQRLFWSATSFLRALAEASPVALLLDDLHWADASSIELLGHLVRQLAAYPVLFAGTYREAEVDQSHPLARAVIDLTRERLVERVPLSRLGKDETATLIAEAVGGDVSNDFVTLVHKQTDGNPFYSEELSRSLTERGHAREHAGSWSLRAADQIEIPETIRAVIWQRLTRLSEAAQAALSRASVFGQSFAFDDLLSLTEAESSSSALDAESQLEAALDEAVRAGVVRTVAEDTYSFSHGLIQQALYTELSPRRRRRLHLSVAEALGVLPEKERKRRSGELAWNFVRGGDPARGFPYALLAGDQAEEVFAHDEAFTQYGSALELAGQLEDGALEAKAQERLGSLLTATIKYAAALEMDEAAATLYAAAGDIESESRVMAQIGRIHVVNGTTDKGIERLERYLERIPQRLSGGGLASLHSSLANLYFAAERYSEALEQAISALALASEAKALGVESEAQVRRGATLAMLGEEDAALDVLSEAVTRAEAANDHFGRCRAWQYLAGIWLRRRDTRRAEGYLKQALQLAERMGNPRQIAVSCLGLSLAALLSGDLSSSSENAERALGIMHSLEGSWPSACQISGFDGELLNETEKVDAPQYLLECLAVARRRA